jgi:uncharacterized protein YndB with AHSA1/START domain
MIAASAEELWAVINDPHHLPRWWPRVARVEDVEGDAFTEVMRTAKGKTVRADFTLVEADERARSLRWSQRVEGTPFARVLKSAETEVRLAPASEGPSSSPRPADPAPTGGDGRDPATSDVGATTEVTIELHQTLNGFLARIGAFLVRRAAAATIDEALDGLERISG